LVSKTLKSWWLVASLLSVGCDDALNALGGVELDAGADAAAGGAGGQAQPGGSGGQATPGGAGGQAQPGGSSGGMGGQALPGGSTGGTGGQAQPGGKGGEGGQALPGGDIGPGGSGGQAQPGGSGGQALPGGDIGPGGSGGATGDGGSGGQAQPGGDIGPGGSGGDGQGGAIVVVPDCVAGQSRACGPEDCVGVQLCENEAWGPCQAPAETCNGQDDDCDGDIDEDFAVGDACAAGIGACLGRGETVCTADGRDVICDAVAGQPGVEVCNDADDDCDGAIDEDFPVGTVCALGQGACGAVGALACDPAGGVTCAAEPGSPNVETCNGIDDDCDGDIDEDFHLGERCASGVGVCEAAGAWVCGADGQAACDAVPGAGGDETCNGLDDNCDGTPDEGFGVGNVCSVGVGACARPSQLDCNANGGVSCVGVAGQPSVERCNTIDDDCDGQIDEDFNVGQVCTVGVGACQAPGTFVCDPVGGVLCRGPIGQPGVEVCNGIDDDCDGQTDEGLGGGACQEQQGVCNVPGVLVCRGGQGLVCDTQGAVPGVEFGDGSDGALVVRGRVALVPRVYQYTSILVTAGGVLTTQAWNGANGGLLDLRVQGEVRVEAGGSIDVSGLGFRGGAANPKVVRGYQNQWTNDGGSTGFHGEGPGGGGGGWAAPQGTVGSGGGGAYAAAGAAGTYCGADDRNFYSVWDNNSGTPISITNPPARFSSGGVAYGEDTLDAARGPHFGSGGGSGGNNYDGGPNGIGGAGGNGGGAVRIQAGTVTLLGSIVANGTNGQVGGGGSYVGGGGGGAGGSVLLRAGTVSFAGTLSATGGGGAGGSNGAGGGGGVGRIRVEAGIFNRLGLATPAPSVGPLPCAGLSFAGIRTGVAENELLAGGFRPCFTGLYNVDPPVAQIQADCDQSVLVVACRPVNAPQTLTVAAMGTRAEVFRVDPADALSTHLHNGVAWYFTPGFSWGFAPPGAAISRGQCDTEGSLGEQRLCWHTLGDVGGYRCGATQGLNESVEWERVIYERGGAL
jgi:hypothetical protein